MTTLFTESAVAPVKSSENTWKATLITPGKGSSGFYSESLLKEYGPVAFPKGTHSYIDHPVAEGEVRSPKNLMGVLTEDARYEDGVGLVAEIQVMPHWKEFVEAVAPHTGLSIYASGEGSRNEDGVFTIETLEPSVMNSVDLVSYAGRPGSGLAEKLYESALAAFSAEGTAATAETVTPIEEGNPNMDEIKEMIAELPKLVAAAITESLTPAEEPEEKDEIDVAAVAEAMVAANLPEVSRKAVYESLLNGVELADAIESQKALVESVAAHLKESATPAPVVVEEALVVNNESAKTESLASILNIKIGAN